MTMLPVKFGKLSDAEIDALKAWYLSLNERIRNNANADMLERFAGLKKVFGEEMADEMNCLFALYTAAIGRKDLALIESCRELMIDVGYYRDVRPGEIFNEGEQGPVEYKGKMVVADDDFFYKICNLELEELQSRRDNENGDD